MQDQLGGDHALKNPLCGVEENPRDELRGSWSLPGASDTAQTLLNAPRVWRSLSLPLLAWNMWEQGFRDPLVKVGLILTPLFAPFPVSLFKQNAQHFLHVHTG